MIILTKYVILRELLYRMSYIAIWDILYRYKIFYIQYTAITMSHSPLEIMCIVLDILYAYRRSYIDIGSAIYL